MTKRSSRIFVPIKLKNTHSNAPYRALRTALGHNVATVRGGDIRRIELNEFDTTCARKLCEGVGEIYDDSSGVLW
jgi:hypothetical protein